MTTILLIEDSMELAQVILRELRVAGYEVLHAGDGPTGIDVFTAEKPDLTILDWMLPGLDGLEVLRRIRITSAQPVLMLTARDEEMDRVLGLELGADDYLTKPFSMRELLARVRALLRRIDRVQRIMQEDRQAHGDELVYADLILIPASYEVALRGQPLNLTRTEFELLHLFMRNTGRVFSRTYLLDAVWGEHYVTGDRSVDNAILRLRKKMGCLGEAIETVWGMGYRMKHESA